MKFAFKNKLNLLSYGSCHHGCRHLFRCLGHDRGLPCQPVCCHLLHQRPHSRHLAHVDKDVSLTIMDSDAAAAPLLALACAVPPSGPKSLQLSPVPGDIYDTDCFFYDPATNVSQGDFGAVLVFASLYGHPVAVHECPDL
jgi:hypothetical protein